MTVKQVVAALGMAACVQGAQAGGMDAHAESLCSADEVVVAACTLKGKPEKMLSICASAKAPRENHVAYRFGTKKKTEMTYLVDGADKGRQVYRGTYVGASGQTTLYWFHNSGYTYKVAIPGTGVARLSVLKKDKLVLSRDCTSNVAGDPEASNSLFVEKSADETFDMWTKGE